jgi:hypothetical protein
VQHGTVYMQGRAVTFWGPVNCGRGPHFCGPLASLANVAYPLRGARADQPRKILRSYGGLDAISAIRNTEIDLKLKVRKGGKLSAGVQGQRPGKF